MGVGKSPTANPEDAPALWDVRPCAPARKECSCLPVPHSCRLCHAQGDIHMHLARQILELPPCHTPGLPDRLKHPTVSGLEIWCLASSRLSFHIRQAHVVLPPKAGVWCLFCEDCSPWRRKGPLPPLLHCTTSMQSFNPALRDLDCGHSLNARALQTPIKALLLLLVFPLSGFSQDPPSCPAETTPPMLQ